MAIMLRQKIALKTLRKIVRGTPIKLIANDVGNVKISGGGFNTVFGALGGTVAGRVSTLDLVKARVKLWKLNKRIKRRKK